MCSVRTMFTQVCRYSVVLTILPGLHKVSLVKLQALTRHQPAGVLFSFASVYHDTWFARFGASLRSVKAPNSNPGR